MPMAGATGISNLRACISSLPIWTCGTSDQPGGPVKIEHTYELWRGEELLAVASTTLACVNAKGRPQVAPDFCRV